MSSDQILLKRSASSLSGSQSQQDERPTKLGRRRLETTNTANFVPTAKSKTFLLLHLQILRALYCDPFDSDTNQSNIEDGDVHDDLWDKIRNFMKERSQIQTMSEEVSSLDALCEEALAFMKEQQEIASSMLSPLGTSGGITNVFSARTSLLSSQLSPRMARFSGSLLSGEEMMGEGGSFGLVAGLLRQKSILASDGLRNKIGPFRPLLEDVEKRINKLQLLLGQIENSLPATDSTGMNSSSAISAASSSLGSKEEDDETIARLETKLCLWKMLLLELKSAGSG